VRYCENLAELAASVLPVEELLMHVLLKCKVPVTVSEHRNKVGIRSTCQSRNGCHIAGSNKLP